MNRYKVKRGRWRRRFVRLFLLAGVVAVIWFSYLYYRIENVAQADPSDQHDAGIVLGAALWNNEPSPGLRERLEQALKVYEAGQVKVLIVSGGMDGNGSTITEAAGMKRYLVAKGVPEEHVFEEHHATNTYENLLYSQAIMEANGWERAVVISHDYHGARAKDIAKFIGMKDPAVSTTPTVVMEPYKHIARELLATTKWELMKGLDYFNLK